MTTSRDLHAAAEAVLSLPAILAAEQERRGLSMRALATQTGLTTRVVARTLKGGLPTAHHAAILLDWAAQSRRIK